MRFCISAASLVHNVCSFSLNADANAAVVLFELVYDIVFDSVLAETNQSSFGLVLLFLSSGILGGSDSNVMDDDQIMLDPNSIIGMFVRRCLLTFNQMSFEVIVCRIPSSVDVLMVVLSLSLYTLASWCPCVENTFYTINNSLPPFLCYNMFLLQKSRIQNYFLISGYLPSVNKYWGILQGFLLRLPTV